VQAKTVPREADPDLVQGKEGIQAVAAVVVAAAEAAIAVEVAEKIQTRLDFFGEELLPLKLIDFYCSISLMFHNLIEYRTSYKFMYIKSEKNILYFNSSKNRYINYKIHQGFILLKISHLQ
jgi:hypothetical protein